MPKLKTHRGTAKRVRITRRGTVLRDRANDTHFKEKQGGGRQRAIEVKAVISGKNAKNIKRALGV